MGAAKPAPKVARLDAWTLVCSKCGETFHAQQTYLTHIQVGYKCGPVAR